MAEVLAAGDVITLNHGPFESDWKVLEVKEHGAELALVSEIRFVGFPRVLIAPNGQQLTSLPTHEWLGRAHFASAKRRGAWPGTTGEIR